MSTVKERVHRSVASSGKIGRLSDSNDIAVSEPLGRSGVQTDVVRLPGSGLDTGEDFPRKLIVQTLPAYDAFNEEPFSSEGSRNR